MEVNASVRRVYPVSRITCDGRAGFFNGVGAWVRTRGSGARGGVGITGEGSAEFSRALGPELEQKGAERAGRGRAG